MKERMAARPTLPNILDAPCLNEAVFDQLGDGFVDCQAFVVGQTQHIKNHGVQLKAVR